MFKLKSLQDQKFSAIRTSLIIKWRGIYKKKLPVLLKTFQSWTVGPALILKTDVNSLAPLRCGSNSKRMKLTTQNSSLGTCCEISLMWMPQNLTNEKSTLIQVMAWCHQATSHYLGQCWLNLFCHIVSLGHYELALQGENELNVEQCLY